MITVGLTGGIASGKSTVASILRGWGIPVVDADQVARSIVEPGEPALEEIIEEFGAGVVHDDGTLDRPALREIVTTDAEARRALERITHPRIGERIRSWLAEQASRGTYTAAVEAALMVETGSYRLYDRLLVVACDPDVQLRRLLDRDGSSEAQARKWVATQFPVDQKVALADAVVWNNSSPEDLHGALEDAWAAMGLSRS